MIKPYFKSGPDDPAPLRIQVERSVRFEEVDMLGIVWHGRYASFFEDARSRLGERFGIGYMDFYNNRVIAPIKKMHVDYHFPIRFNDHIRIEGILHWSEALRLNHEFRITDQEGTLLTGGYTVQLMLDQDQNLLMIAPPFIEQFRQRWKAGEFK